MVNLSGSCLYKFALSVGWAVSTNLLPQRKQPSYLKASVERKELDPMVRTKIPSCENIYIYMHKINLICVKKAVSQDLL